MVPLSYTVEGVISLEAGRGASKKRWWARGQIYPSWRVIRQSFFWSRLQERNARETSGLTCLTCPGLASTRGGVHYSGGLWCCGPAVRCWCSVKETRSTAIRKRGCQRRVHLGHAATYYKGAKPSEWRAASRICGTHFGSGLDFDALWPDATAEKPAIPQNEGASNQPLFLARWSLDVVQRGRVAACGVISLSFLLLRTTVPRSDWLYNRRRRMADSPAILDIVFPPANFLFP